MERLLRVCVFMIMAVFALSLVAASPGIARDGGAAALRAFLLDARWKGLFRSLPTLDVDAQGYVGLNRGGAMRFPELQAVGGTIVTRGLLNKRQDWREQGWRILDAGMVKMQADGRLAGNGRDLVHSSSFLLQALGSALLVDPSEASPERKSRFLKAVRYLAAQPALAEARDMTRRFTHRAFLWSLMFGVAAELEPEEVNWAVLAREFMNSGIDAQTAEGVFPEAGGFDALYQAIGVDILLKASALTSNAEDYARQQWAAVRALAVLVSRVNERGRLDVSGSTRVLNEKTRSGQSKRLSHWQAAEPFYGAWVSSEDSFFLNVAQRVMRCDLACQSGQPKPVD